MQLLKAISFMKVVNAQKKVKLIGADFDRGYESSIIFAVAKANKIQSFVFQHGALNPPVGYYPVNADEVWVWGEMSKIQYLEKGVPEKKVLVTGTPILSEMNLSSQIKQKLMDKYSLKNGKNIVLALSSPDKPRDIEQVEFFASLKKMNIKSDDNYLVKIHPARNVKDYKWITDSFNIKLLPHNIKISDFMHIVDILLTHSSGLANEAIYCNKKVGILDILDIPPMNGMELNKYLGVTLVKKSMSVKDIFGIKYVDKKLLFYKVGNDAASQIRKEVKYRINL